MKPFQLGVNFNIMKLKAINTILDCSLKIPTKILQGPGDEKALNFRRHVSSFGQMAIFNSPYFFFKIQCVLIFHIPELAMLIAFATRPVCISAGG